MRPKYKIEERNYCHQNLVCVLVINYHLLNKIVTSRLNTHIKKEEYKEERFIGVWRIKQPTS